MSSGQQQLNELTKEQEAMIPVYRDRYIAIGLNTDRINKDYCQEVMNEFYVKILKRNAVKIHLCKDPKEALEMCYFYEILKERLTKKSFLKKVEPSTGEYPKVYFDVIDELFGNTKVSLPEVGILNTLISDINKEIQAIENRYVYNYLYGSFDAYYFSFYSFFKNECGVKYDNEELYDIYEKTLNFGFIYAMEDVCFVSEKPIEINIKEDKLHADLKPALKYQDGLELYRLNGVKVPKWMVVTPASELDVKKIYEIDNVEVRQEFIRKVGLKRVLQELNSDVIDEITGEELYTKYPITNYIQQGDVVLDPEFESEVKFNDLKKDFKSSLKHLVYKLYNLKIRENEYRPYLYMTNASIPSECHIEGVPAEIKTVFDAICWRNNKTSLPCILT